MARRGCSPADAAMASCFAASLPPQKQNPNSRAYNTPFFQFAFISVPPKIRLPHTYPSPSILRTFSCPSGTQAGSARNTAPLFHRKRKFPAARPEIPLPPDCHLTVYLQKKRLFSTNFFVFLLHCFSARPRHFAEISCFRKNAACGGFHTAENMV